MWWTFFIIFILISLFSTTALFYSLRRINQYENLITQIQQIITFSTERMKTIDSKGTFESDDEVGFFFKEIKEIQSILDDIFELEEKENA
jgi:hypothetical protein|tara:strand:- start:186 stop:455 length:270 start_codon:yes stop_codon:yes gene_type:complete